MKILLIHVFFTDKFANGANVIAFETYNALKENGCETYFFATSEQPYIEDNYAYAKYFIDYNLKKDPKTYHLHNLYNTKARLNLEKYLDEIKPDIVHIHSIWEISYSIIEPIKKRNIPIVFTVHDASLVCPNSLNNSPVGCFKCSRFNTLPCILNKCRDNNYKKSAYLALRGVIWRALGSLDKIEKFITPSNAMRKYIVDFGISEKKVTTIENFVSNEYLKLEPSYNDNNYFIYAGSIIEKKGIKTLLETFKELPPDINLRIAGEGCYEEELENYITENNLTNVKFLGKLNKQELFEQYKNSIAIITPSEWFECFGLINIEAALFAKPAIAASAGAIPEIVEDNNTGLIFEPKNKEQLKNCIMKYQNDRGLVHLHGENAYNKVRKYYTLENHITKLLNVYEEVIKK